MTELEKALRWLETIQQEADGNMRENPWHGDKYKATMKNCRVLLDALRWTPCSTRMPTEDDADENGYVLTIDTSDVQETFEAAEIENWNKTHDRKITHWRPLPAPPEEG